MKRSLFIGMHSFVPMLSCTRYAWNEIFVFFKLYKHDCVSAQKSQVSNVAVINILYSLYFHRKLTSKLDHVRYFYQWKFVTIARALYNVYYIHKHFHKNWAMAMCPHGDFLTSSMNRSYQRYLDSFSSGSQLAENWQKDLHWDYKISNWLT